MLRGHTRIDSGRSPQVRRRILVNKTDTTVLGDSDGFACRSPEELIIMKHLVYVRPVVDSVDSRFR